MKSFPYLILFAGLLTLSAIPSKKHPAEGDWLTSDGSSKITIAPCGTKFCGKVSWIKNATATVNEKGLGLLIIKDFEPTNERTLEKGQIHDPRNDKWYKGRLIVGDDGRLEVRGWVGLPAFGKSQYWTRAN